MSKGLEKIVASLELCKQIPAGEFEDTALVWLAQTMTTHAAVAVAVDAADAVAVAAAAGAVAYAVAAYDAERAAQLEILRSLPNPFAELKNNIV